MATIAIPESRAVPVPSRFSAFAVFAYLVLFANILVILWGAYVRATGSGAGCGSHWPLCNGEVVPKAAGSATYIEFTHRVTSGVALLGVIGLWFWARRQFAIDTLVRKAAGWSVVFILIEALLGAGLVLLRYVGDNASVGRAIYLSAHLVNTLILLACLFAVAWLSHRPLPAGVRIPRFVAICLGLTLVVGVSGAVAALGDTLFPASSVVNGIRADVAAAGHFLVRLRILHPVISCIAAVAIVGMAVLSVRRRAMRGVSSVLIGVVLVQLIAGGVNVLLLAPVAMQMIHLGLADFLWLALIAYGFENAREAVG